MARTSAAEKYPYLPSSVTNFNYKLPKDNSQKATKDRVYGYTTLNPTQQKAANIDPRIAQKAQTTSGTYVPTSTTVTNTTPPSGGGGGNVTVSAPVVQSNPYEGYMNRMISLYEKQLADEKARQEQLRQERIAAANKIKEQRINATNATYDASMANLNDAKESSLRQAYIKYMQEQRALPQQLQAMGLAGGATETTLANLKNSYGTNRTDIMNNAATQQRMIEQDRANAIAGAEADAAAAQVDAFADASNYQASAEREYNNGLLDVYASALKPSTATSTVQTSNIKKNPWYDVAVNYLKDGSSTNDVITTLRQQGVSDDIIDAILYSWESTI